ncbi:glutamate--cysteine ligase [Dispira simplex]|nr:glutamate--cysteine ligase [Dispira simplex]
MDYNIQVAHRNDACRREKFYFRKNIFTGPSTTAEAHSVDAEPSLGSVDQEYELMTLDEIINGHENQFIGLIPLVNAYLDSINVNIQVRCKIQQYLDLVSRRANGTLLTNAQWIRQFVRRHPEYRQDSVVTERINYDLLKTVHDITDGKLRPADLL